MQEDIVLRKTKRSRFSWKIFGIMMTVVAILGVAFGTVTMVIKNNEIAKIKEEHDILDNGTSSGLDILTGNPILAAEAPKVYTIIASSSTFQSGENMAYLNLKVQNGALTECKMSVRDASGSYNKNDCEISGIVGKIYKIAQISGGNVEGFKSGLGLIMTDGTVKYVPLDETSGNVFSVKGVLNLDGYVVDVIGAEIRQNQYLEGSDWSTLFVLKSGEVVEFSETVLEGV